jgi:hypothetical protein
MAKNALHAIEEAESEIQERQKHRSASESASQLGYRQAEALELIADELTRIRAEVRTLRYLLAASSTRQSSRA